MSVSTCAYTYINVSTRVDVCSYAHACKCVNCVHVYTHACSHVHVSHICVHTCELVCPFVCVHIHMNVCTYVSEYVSVFVCAGMHIMHNETMYVWLCKCVYTHI